MYTCQSNNIFFYNFTGQLLDCMSDFLTQVASKTWCIGDFLLLCLFQSSHCWHFSSEKWKQTWRLSLHILLSAWQPWPWQGGTAPDSPYQSSEALFMSLLIDLDLKSAFHVDSDPSWSDRSTSANSFWFRLAAEKSVESPAFLMTNSRLERFTSTCWRRFSSSDIQTTWGSLWSTGNSAHQSQRVSTKDTHECDIEEELDELLCWRLPSITMTIEMQLLLTRRAKQCVAGVSCFLNSVFVCCCFFFIYIYIFEWASIAC